MFHPPSGFLLYLARNGKFLIRFHPNQNTLFAYFLLDVDLNNKTFQQSQFQQKGESMSIVLFLFLRVFLWATCSISTHQSKILLLVFCIRRSCSAEIKLSENWEKSEVSPGTPFQTSEAKCSRHCSATARNLISPASCRKWGVLCL